MNWNHDLSQAPRGKMVPYTRKGKDGPVQSEQYRKEYILAVDEHGVVSQSYWIPPRHTQSGGLLEGNRWSGFNPGVDPIAWAPWPEYHFEEPQRQQGTDGGEIAAVKVIDRLANAAGVEPSPSDHFILEDVGGGA